MATTVISTHTTAGVGLDSYDSLVVLAQGSIVNPAATIGSYEETNQYVTIAGLVEIDYIWLGGANRVSIAEGATLVGHSLGWAIFLGTGTGQYIGNSIVSNAGYLQADFGAIYVFGEGNLVTNSGQIVSGGVGITTDTQGANTIKNSGSISSQSVAAVQLSGDDDALFNSGTLGCTGPGVSLRSTNQVLSNTGQIVSTTSHGVEVIASGSRIDNQGSIDAQKGAAIKIEMAEFSNATVITNTGSLTGEYGIYSQSNSTLLVNNGTILANFIAAIYIDTTAAGSNQIVNSGVISSLGYSILTSAGNDTIMSTGTLIGNVSTGAGDDRIDLRGGTMLGSVSGGTGADTYLIDDASIFLDETASAVGEVDTVFATVSYELEVDFEALNLMGGGNINGAGNALGNTVTGNAGDNRLSGHDGGDTVSGMGGDDTLRGGLALDSLSGGNGDDRLYGGAASDTLQGGEDDDVLNGGSGRDTLAGGAGNDVFLFDRLADTAATTGLADIISDFTQAVDLINLGLIDARTGNSKANDTFAFIGTAAFSSAAGQLRFVQSGGNTFVEMDATGDGVADGMIRLNGLFTLTAADFVL